MDHGEYKGEAYIYSHREVLNLIRDIAGKLLLKKEAVFIDDRLHLVEISDGHDPDTDALLFATLTGDEQLDLVICREEDFADFAGEGMFFPLGDVFTAEELDRWSQSVVACPGLLATDSAPEDIYDYYGKGEVQDFGLRISDSGTWRKLMQSDGDYVCGLLGLGANPENAERFVRFMMEH